MQVLEKTGREPTNTSKFLVILIVGSVIPKPSVIHAQEVLHSHTGGRLAAREGLSRLRCPQYRCVDKPLLEALQVLRPRITKKAKFFVHVQMGSPTKRSRGVQSTLLRIWTQSPRMTQKLILSFKV